MSVSIREATSSERDALLPLLRLAEPSARALRWSLSHLSDTLYRMDADGELVGAASMRWSGDPCEIVELAVAETRHGQGFGRRLVEWLLAEARRRGKRAMLVGTGNASIGNFAFYQRCGFRIVGVKRDYFSYNREPRVIGGIEERDLVLFRHELDG